MKRITLLIVSVFAVSVATADDAQKPSAPPTSLAAVAAIKEADGEIAKAKEAYDKSVADAHKTELVELKQAEVAAMKNANLDEANRINAAIACVQTCTPLPGKVNKKPDPKAELTEKLVGTEWNNSGVSVVFNSDGSTTRSDGLAGNWAVISESTVIFQQSNGWVDIWKLDNNISRFDAVSGEMTAHWSGKRVN